MLKLIPTYVPPAARASVFLPVAPDALAEAGKDAHERSRGRRWDQKKGTLQDFFGIGRLSVPRLGARITGELARGEARSAYAALIKIAISFEKNQLATKLEVDREFYAGDQTPKLIRNGGDPTRILQLGNFYANTKGVLESFLSLVKSKNINDDLKIDALNLLDYGLSIGDGSNQHEAYEAARRVVGGVEPSLKRQLHLTMESEFDKIRDEFVSSKPFSIDGKTYKPEDPARAQKIKELGGSYMVALAHELGADDDYGIEKGVHATDRQAQKVGFEEADIKSAKSQLVHSNNVPNIISRTSHEVLSAFARLLEMNQVDVSGCEKFTLDTMCVQGFDEKQLDSAAIHHLARLVARDTGLAAEDLMSIALRTDSSGARIFDRNPGLLQLHMVEALAKNGAFSVETLSHDVVTTNEFKVQRRGPVYTVSDLNTEGIGHHGAPRALRLDDLARLCGPRDQPSQWGNIPEEDRLDLLEWAKRENEPAYREEMMGVLEKPGLFMTAIEQVTEYDDGKKECGLEDIFGKAARTLRDEVWERAKWGLKKAPDEEAISILHKLHIETKTSLPASTDHGSKPTRHLADVLYGTRKISELGQLLSKNHLPSAPGDIDILCHLFWKNRPMPESEIKELGSQYKRELTERRSASDKKALPDSARIEAESDRLLSLAMEAVLAEPDNKAHVQAVCRIFDHFPVTVVRADIREAMQKHGVAAELLESLEDPIYTQVQKNRKGTGEPVAAPRVFREPDRVELEVSHELSEAPPPVRKRASRFVERLLKDPQALSLPEVAISPSRTVTQKPKVPPKGSDLQAKKLLAEFRNKQAQTAASAERPGAPRDVERVGFPNPLGDRPSPLRAVKRVASLLPPESTVAVNRPIATPIEGATAGNPPTVPTKPVEVTPGARQQPRRPYR
jgi:hypothetical protein